MQVMASDAPTIINSASSTGKQSRSLSEPFMRATLTRNAVILTGKNAGTSGNGSVLGDTAVGNWWSKLPTAAVSRLLSKGDES